jgi:Holliday junction resolvase RusA-like endonuclease
MMREELLSVYVVGTPKGQPRPRAFSRGGHARVYDPGTAEGWKGEIALALRSWANARFDGPLRVVLHFNMPRPAGHFRKSGELRPTLDTVAHVQKPDLDNLAKAVFDCLTAIGVWNDDAQVSSLVASRAWSRDRSGGCQIRVLREEF